jgi:hypothetical protein
VTSVHNNAVAAGGMVDGYNVQQLLHQLSPRSGYQVFVKSCHGSCAHPCTLHDLLHLAVRGAAATQQTEWVAFVTWPVTAY